VEGDIRISLPDAKMGEINTGEKRSKVKK